MTNVKEVAKMFSESQMTFKEIVSLKIPIASRCGSSEANLFQFCLCPYARCFKRIILKTYETKKSITLGYESSKSYV